MIGFKQNDFILENNFLQTKSLKLTAYMYTAGAFPNHLWGRLVACYFFV